MRIQCLSNLPERSTPALMLTESIIARGLREMLASLNSVQKKQERLIEITAGGAIEKDGIKGFIDIRDELKIISTTVETLQLWIEQKIACNSIDSKAYLAARNRGN